MIALLLVAAQETAAPPAPVERDLPAMLESITADEIEAHVAALAAPEMGGRGTGSPGYERAAAYVEAELRRLGLVGPGENGSYRLGYELDSIVADRCTFAVSTGPGSAQAFAPGRDFVPLLGSAEAAVAGEPVFAGFAIEDRSERWLDLPERKVRGKVVFAFTREPFADDRRSRRFAGLEATDGSRIRAKAEAVAAAGGIALVVVPDPGQQPLADEPLGGVVPAPSGRLLDLERLRRRSFADIPVVSVSRRVAAAVFGADPEAYYARLAKRKRPSLLDPADERIRVEIGVEWAEKPVRYENVAALLPGRDGDGELVVLGAHLDHVGQNYLASELWRSGTTAIHPGADDNASGSAALLEVAEALAGTRPREDVLFLWFFGEELGLLGSREYCAAPLRPLDQTILMLNLDMIGRTDPKEFQLGGLEEWPGWEKPVRQALQASRVRIRLDSRGGRDLYARSDQFSFHQAGVPGLFFFEGDLAANETYHRPSDVAATFDGRKAAAVARVFLTLARAVAFDGVRAR
ncbi:MAG: M28 family peptidase [Planctomycetota bacterium]|nr:MAG: M28 family peptidase [Planctomycetota bacterium]